MSNASFRIAQFLLFAFFISGSLVVKAYEQPELSERMSENLKIYANDISWLIARANTLAEQYEADSTATIDTNSLSWDWEKVAVHLAIENHHEVIYSEIWMAMFHFTQAIADKAPIADVRAKLHDFEMSLTQAMGAVRLAAQYYDWGLLENYYVQRDCSQGVAGVAATTKGYFDRIVAKACRVVD